MIQFLKNLFGGTKNENQTPQTYRQPELVHEQYTEEEEEEIEEEEEELTEQEIKMRERDRRISEAMAGPTVHVFDEHDKSPQGQKAISQGISNKQNGKHLYDYTKSAGADFSWPDYQPSQIGHLEPWLCYGAEEDSGWIDLNEFPNGTERRGRAAYRILGHNENEAFVYADAKTITELESILKMDDATLNTEAPKLGMKSDSLYSYRDYVLGMKLDYEKIYRRNNERAQAGLDVANQMMQEEMNANIEAAKAGGLLDPIKGISMEDWAVANAKIASGMPLDEVLKVLGTEKPIWDEITNEWQARMQRDTTFAIAKVYGDAFTNPSISAKFATASGGNGAASTNSEVVEKVKNDMDLYVKIMCHQSVGSTQGLDATSILKQYGLSVVEWSTISSYWSPKVGSNLELAMRMSALMDKYNAEFAAAAPVKAGSDIDF